MENNNEYKDITKSNFVFGSVKILQVLVSILKVKIVAILLGPIGVSIQTLLNSTIITFYQFTNFGIAQSSVREISIDKDPKQKKIKVKVVNYLAFILGILSSFFCFIFSSILSQFVFGTIDYSYMFKIVSISLFFESISSIQVAILQSLRFITILSKSSLIGAIVSLLISIPFYYLWRRDAIPYVLVLGYMITAIIYFIFRFKKYSCKIKVSRNDFKNSSKSILGLGVILMIGNSIMSLLNLGLNVFINRYGTNVDVGYFQAASTCSYSVINILLVILASDFYPRISSDINDREKSINILNTQVELLLLILGPLVCLIIVIPNIFVRILYSSEFLIIINAIRIMVISLFFRIIWHCFSYIILAKGDKKTYLLADAILGNGLFFIGNIAGFYFYRINGIAISYVVVSIIVMFMLYFIVNNKYNIKLNNRILKLMILLVFLSVVMLFVNFYISGVIKFVVSWSIVISISFYSCIVIEKRTSIFKIIFDKLKIWKRK